MLKKPEKYDEIVVNEDFVPIKLGGHKGVILKAEEYTSPISENTSLKIVVDTAKDDSQPEYFKKQYESNTQEDKKWSNSAIRYVSLKEDENCARMLKAFITAVENSNNNYSFDWKKEVDQLVGKKVGLVFGLEEYENNQGEIKINAKLQGFRSINKVDTVEIPKVKLINGERMDYDDYMELRRESNGAISADSNESDTILIDPENLPF